MKKSEIQKIYKNKLSLINKHNESYYDKSSPIISDSEYDILKKDLLELEKNINF